MWSTAGYADEPAAIRQRKGEVRADKAAPSKE